MSVELAFRMQEIEEGAARGDYYAKLLQLTGSIEAAARLDLVIEGRFAHLDLRMRPFTSDLRMKAEARQAREMQANLTRRLLSTVWRVDESTDRSDS